jgi:hypothetical protein
MNIVELEKKLIAAAKTATPSDAVPYAFEKRITARLSSRPMSDAVSQWAAALWRATVPCFVIMLFLAIWNLVATAAPPPPAMDLTQQMEGTVLAAAEQEQVSDAAW